MKKLILILFVCLEIVSCIKPQPKIIRIVPFEAIPSSHLEVIKSALVKTYALKVVVNDPIPLPETAFVKVKTPRFRADKLIYFLKTNVKTREFKAGYTSKDISTTKKDAYGRTLKPEFKYEDWGVFGLGYKPGKACVVSTFRIGNKGEAKLKERLAKIFVHEIGHNLGLAHCDNSKCVMTDAAESIATIDNVYGSLCTKCKRQIE